MKKFLLIFAFFAVSQVLVAQSKDEKAVAEAVESLRKAMIDADKATLEALAAEDLSYGHSGGSIENKAEFVEAIVSGKSDFVKIDLADQTIKIVGNTAIVRHKLAADTNNSGKPGTAKLSVLLIWQKQKGDWKLLARQAVKI
ncbi:MAG: nuclear transport factor 2 family protein [Spirosomataceae bacterium]